MEICSLCIIIVIKHVIYSCFITHVCTMNSCNSKIKILTLESLIVTENFLKFNFNLYTILS